MPQAGRIALSLVTRYQFMVLHSAWPVQAMERVVMMHVGGAIDPRPLPTRIGDEHFVSIPDEASGSPSPRAKCEAERQAKSEDDGPANEESGSGK
jgi:hypothetical protein